MKLILMCDYGLDDAAATADALAHAKADGYEEIQLVAVGGNVPAAVALRNARKLLAALPDAGVPVLLVDTTHEKQNEEFLKHIHGGDGMGDLFCTAGEEIPAVPFCVWTERLCGEYCLLSLGPMTLVPRVLEGGNCRRFLFMGGNIRETPNYHGYEFNHGMDRAAFSRAVRTVHVAVTMDTCRNPLFDNQPKALAGGGVMRKIVNRAREMTFSSGEKGSYVWDDIAVKALRHPDWFSYRTETDCDGNILNVAYYHYGKPYSEIVEL